MDTALTYGKCAYGTVIVGAFVIGACRGLMKWVSWMDRRAYRKIHYETLEPIVNVSCDVGKLAYDVVGCGAASAAVAGTAPVSVPILLYAFSK